MPLAWLGRVISRPALLVVALVLAAAARGQDAVKFDPGRDLEGFEQASGSEYRDLYPLKPYLERSGQEIAPEDLRKLREQWKVEREAVAKRIEAILADPREDYLYRLEKRLARHAYFSKVRFDVDRSVEGSLFLVQRPSVGDPVTLDTRKYADFYGPPMRKIQEAFEKGFTRPFSFARRDDYPVFSVCILENEDEYHAFGQTTEQMWRMSAAYYEPRLKMIVAYGDPYAPDTTPARQRRLILSEFVRALEHAYYLGKDERQSSLWLNLGFASWFGWREGVLAEAKDKTVIDTYLLAQVVKLSQAKEDSALLLHPIIDLMQVRSTSDILLLSKNRAQELGTKEPEIDRALHAFYGQAALWMHFLYDSQGGRYREAFLKFFQSAMNGLGGLDAFYLSFRGIDVGGLDKEFYSYLYAEHERVFPKVKLDRAWSEGPFADRKPERKPAAPGSAAAALPRVTDSAAPFAPAAIAVGPKDFDGLHGLALVQAMHGDLEGALHALENLAAGGPEPPEDVRIAREIERVQQFMLLREGYFANLIRSGQPLSGKYRGLEYIAKVEKVEDGWIFLGENKLGLSKIPLAAVEPFEIARQAGRKEEQGAAEPWARFWPYILVGEKKWEQLLKDDSEKAKDLREDARTWYPEVQKAAKAAVALNEIAATPEPRTQKDGEKFFAAVKALLASFGDLPLVQRRTDALRQAVAGVIVRTSPEEDPSKMCHGTWTSLGNGLVNIVYDFNKPEEAKDFYRVPGYLDDIRKTQPATVKKEEDSKWAVAAGEFAGSGSACYRHFADLQAPIVLRYDVVFRETATKGTAPPAFMFMIGACDDGQGSYVACANFGSLCVSDRPNKVFKTIADDKPVFGKKVYHLELRNDGANVTVFANGEKKFAETNAGRKTGAVFLLFHSDHTIAVQRMEIEGKIDPAWPERAKVEHFRSKLAEIGFR